MRKEYDIINAQKEVKLVMILEEIILSLRDKKAIVVTQDMAIVKPDEEDLEEMDSDWVDFITINSLYQYLSFGDVLCWKEGLAMKMAPIDPPVLSNDTEVYLSKTKRDKVVRGQSPTVKYMDIEYSGHVLYNDIPHPVFLYKGRKIQGVSGLKRLGLNDTQIKEVKKKIPDNIPVDRVTELTLRYNLKIRGGKIYSGKKKFTSYNSFKDWLKQRGDGISSQTWLKLKEHLEND